MTGSVVPLRRLYEAKRFEVGTEFGSFAASGTLCGHIDFVGPFRGSYPLSTDEAAALVLMLQLARADVLNNSDPYDPRVVAHLPGAVPEAPRSNAPIRSRRNRRTGVRE